MTNADCSSGYTCPTNGTCEIYCKGTNCAGAILTCPLIGDCYVECREENGCSKTIINAQNQNGNFELLCEDNTDYINDNNIRICDKIQVLGSTLSSNTGTSFLITCGFDRHTCSDGVINCAQGMNCQVNCHSKHTALGVDGARGSCYGLDINGPIDYNLTVQCADNNACQSAIINATDSSLLNLTCFDNNGCCDTNIYCPVNTNQPDICLIAGITIKKYVYCCIFI